MSVNLLTEEHLEFLSLKGGCTCSSESTLVKMPHCWKSRVAVPMLKSMRMKLIKISCADPESFVRGGPTLKTFFFFFFFFFWGGGGG